MSCVRYGLTAEQQQEAETAYEQMVAAVEATRAAAAAAEQQHQQQQGLPADCDIIGEQWVSFDVKAASALYVQTTAALLCPNKQLLKCSLEPPHNRAAAAAMAPF